MSTYTSFEVKAASIVVGIIVYLMAAVIHFADGDPLHLALAMKGRDDDWALVLAMVGSMILYGSVKPKRTCRHIGLVMAMFMMAGIVGLVFQARVATPLTMSVLLAVMLIPVAAWLFATDVLLGLRHRAGH